MPPSPPPWPDDPTAGKGIPLKGQLACAKRILTRMRHDYPRLIAQGRMHETEAALEYDKMAAIVRTLQRLYDAEQAQEVLFAEDHAGGKS